MSHCISLFLPCLLLLSCTHDRTEEKTSPQASFVMPATEVFIPEEDTLDIEQHLFEYEALKKRIAIDLRSHRTETDYQAQAAQHFVSTLVDSLFPYWYGTSWDFNGYTENPRQGQIACGYFVSTTLRDMGIKINRYKVAQKAALDILKTFVKTADIKKFRKFEQMQTYLASSSADEVFILGLDYHVGFVVRKNQKLYFIHSNYFGNSQVEKEDFDKSYSAQSSELFYVGSLSDNPRFIARWLGP